MAGSKKVLIGVNCDLVSNTTQKVVLKSSYISRLVKAGGTPVLIPQSAGREACLALLGLVSGLLLTGGDDYRCSLPDPGLHPPEFQGILQQREEVDILLVKEAYHMDLPVLGICAGMQLMALSRGAAVQPHLPHRNGKQGVIHKDRGKGVYVKHQVDVMGGTLLADLAGTGSREVNSRHHQGVISEGELRVSARSPDGLVEAVEDPDKRFFVGVQWHPEEPGPRPVFQALFDALVSAAGRKVNRARRK